MVKRFYMLDNRSQTTKYVDGFNQLQEGMKHGYTKQGRDASFISKEVDRSMLRPKQLDQARECNSSQGIIFEPRLPVFFCFCFGKDGIRWKGRWFELIKALEAITIAVLYSYWSPRLLVAMAQRHGQQTLPQKRHNKSRRWQATGDHIFHVRSPDVHYVLSCVRKSRKTKWLHNFRGLGYCRLGSS